MMNEKQKQLDISEDSALIPDFDVFNKMREERARVEAEQSESGITKSEKHVADLASHSGWQEVEKHIIERVEALQKGVQGAIANGSSFVEIGERAVIAKMVQEELEGVLNFVRTREKYVKDSRG